MGRNPSSIARAAEWARLGLTGPLPRGSVRAAVDAVARDPDPRVRMAALGALVRRGGDRSAATAWRSAADDADPAVRRRAGELAPALGRAPTRALVRMLEDREPLVAEAAAWALGELSAPGPGAVRALAHHSTDHDDPLVREAAVAALGAIGDDRGLPAVLAATTDKPAVRRRAVLALAPFEGPEVDAALARAATDRDWQVRDAAAALGATSEDRA